MPRAASSIRSRQTKVVASPQAKDWIVHARTTQIAMENAKATHHTVSLRTAEVLDDSTPRSCGSWNSACNAASPVSVLHRAYPGDTRGGRPMTQRHPVGDRVGSIACRGRKPKDVG